MMTTTSMQFHMLSPCWCQCLNPKPSTVVSVKYYIRAKCNRMWALSLCKDTFVERSWMSSTKRVVIRHWAFRQVAVNPSPALFLTIILFTIIASLAIQEKRKREILRKEIDWMTLKQDNLPHQALQQLLPIWSSPNTQLHSWWWCWSPWWSS